MNKAIKLALQDRKDENSSGTHLANISQVHFFAPGNYQFVYNDLLAEREGYRDQNAFEHRTLVCYHGLESRL